MADRNDLEILGLLERIGTFEQLLEVYEHSVIEQSDRLYAEQERLRCQGEASLDGVLSIGKSGEVLFANQRLAEIWRVAPPTLEGGQADQVFRTLAARTTDPSLTPRKNGFPLYGNWNFHSGGSTSPFQLRAPSVE